MVLVLGLAGWLAGAGGLGCGRADPTSTRTPMPFLTPGNGVHRLGLASGRALLGEVSRPVLESESAQDGGIRVPIDAAPESVLHLAVGRTRASCSAWLEPTVGEPTLLARLAPGEDTWTEAAVPLPPTADGVLRLDCPDPGGGASPVWAQPRLVPKPDEDQPGPPLLVLVSMDTLRADFVAGFGGKQPWTPELFRRGVEGMRFTAAVSEGTWTLPSHRALLSSRFPWPQAGDDSRGASLAAELAKQGFATLGLTGGGFVSSRLGLAHGFDAYSEAPDSDADFRGLIQREALPLIDKFSGAPTLLFLHTYAVHRTDVLEAFGFDVQLEVGPGGRDLYYRSPGARRYYKKLVGEADRDLVILFEALEHYAATRPVLLVLVSDHGEGFGEHGLSGHGVGSVPYDPIVRIPFLVWGPGLIPGGRESKRSVSLMDVAPSLLGATGADPPAIMQGTNLWPLWAGRDEPADGAPSLSRSDSHWAIRSADRKLILSRRADGTERQELFHLVKDPRERRDRASMRPAEVAELRSLLEQRARALGGDVNLASPELTSEIDAAEQVDEDLLQRLEALGYTR